VKEVTKALRMLGASIPDVKAGRKRWLVHDMDVPWQRQVGPSCGIASLSMARKALTLSKPDSPSSSAPVWRMSPGAGFPTLHKDPEAATACESACMSTTQVVEPPTSNVLPTEQRSLTATAIELGMSTEGEIYSAAALGTLALASGLLARVIRNWQTIHILDALSKGELVVMPYDRAVTSQSKPCLKNGASAHWAIVRGFAVAVSAEELETIELEVHQEQDEVVWTLNGDRAITTKCGRELEVQESSIVVICQHGMSDRQLVVPLKAMLESNYQLVCDEGKLRPEVGTSLLGEVVIVGSEY